MEYHAHMNSSAVLNVACRSMHPYDVTEFLHHICRLKEYSVHVVSMHTCLYAFSQLMFWLPHQPVETLISGVPASCPAFRGDGGRPDRTSSVFMGRSCCLYDRWFPLHGEKCANSKACRGWVGGLKCDAHSGSGGSVPELQVGAYDDAQKRLGSEAEAENTILQGLEGSAQLWS